MSTMNSKLTFKRGLELKNRIMMAPMTTKMSFYDGVVTSDEINYYALRSGEIGAVITGAANVQNDGKGWEGELSVASDVFIPGLSKLAAAIKKNGTKAILQIFHGGRMTDSSVLRGVQPVAPSAIAAERPNAETPRALAGDEVLDLIENFKAATRRAIEAGFDGVELHGANTYLLQQFFSPHSNRRDDEWGGTLEKRFSFIDKLVDEVTATVDESGAENFIVGYRFSPEEYENPGIRFTDTLFLVDQLADKGLDYLHISLRDRQLVSVSENHKEKSMLAYIHEQINGRVPLVGVGDVLTSEDAEQVLENSELVAVGRALLIDPHWGAKALDKKDDLIRQEISNYDREELFLANGVWGFMEFMMPDRLGK
ncbi:NADH-dependent flavin oxidoreductase [Trichococcus pasteurii]|uniref:Aldolase-type tim barrel n=1 Tax=Trichococcus pasteurii TaxID=43064 RepID=A0A1W1IHN2_9LACT|nr:NADH-dependent flavin oxidoreductase [Trichococcus pasteurii]SFE52824.1 2,4-dienoyl-CoA reductase [Trichococcus pasteurii]SLM52419.1 aldolase-type tim barrel [Trichococcus pasteurii]SSB93300.1 aldolase-type tim barrel [Trichococcus pasteurii]